METPSEPGDIGEGVTSLGPHETSYCSYRPTGSQVESCNHPVQPLALIQGWSSEAFCSPYPSSNRSCPLGTPGVNKRRSSLILTWVSAFIRRESTLLVNLQHREEAGNRAPRAVSLRKVVPALRGNFVEDLHLA